MRIMSPLVADFLESRAAGSRWTPVIMYVGDPSLCFSKARHPWSYSGSSYGDHICVSPCTYVAAVQ